VATANIPSIVEILKKTKSVSELSLKRVRELHRMTGKKIVHILIDEGVISEKELLHVLSSSLGIPMLNLNAYKIDPEVTKLIPKRIAERHEVLPVARIGKVLTIAMSDPSDMVALDDIKKIANGSNVQPVLVSLGDLKAAIESAYAEELKLQDLLEEMDPESITVVQRAKIGDEPEISYTGDEAPVIRMLNVVLHEAVKSRASDIHFEPFADRLKIRYRIDGALREVFTPPRDMYNAVLTRIKIISTLDITEKRLPQDGRFRAKLDEREIDFRVSILPTYHGEKAVLRILDKGNLKAGLEHLGFSRSCIDEFQRSVQKPYGIVLVTGPTGSGKSTTLYAILNQLNTKDRNIMTIEDPVEYQVHGVTQTQVHSDIGLDFARGLRSLLRQSPDIILVGEIRDTETADIAVKASLTGHLVFSTLHTNNAAGAVTRLIDMGVEPFLIASALIATTAQRLVRRICTNCKEAYDVPEEVLKRLPAAKRVDRNVVGHRGKGCKQCKETGYLGRLAAMEILTVDEQIKRMIIDRKSSSEVEAYAIKMGMTTLFDNAFELFKNGQTTLEEVLRVTTYES